MRLLNSDPQETLRQTSHLHLHGALMEACFARDTNEEVICESPEPRHHPRMPEGTVITGNTLQDGRAGQAGQE